MCLACELDLHVFWFVSCLLYTTGKGCALYCVCVSLERGVSMLGILEDVVSMLCLIGGEVVIVDSGSYANDRSLNQRFLIVAVYERVFLNDLVIETRIGCGMYGPCY